MPAYATCSTAAEVTQYNHPPSTIPNTTKVVHQTEISTPSNSEHDNYVSGAIFSYTTQFSDQNVITGQRDPLYAYKAISDPDTLYLHEVTKANNGPQFQFDIQKKLMIEGR